MGVISIMWTPIIHASYTEHGTIIGKKALPKEIEI